MILGKQIEKYIAFVEKTILISGFLVIISGSIFRFISRNFLSSQFAIELSDNISSNLPNLLLVCGIVGASLGVGRGEVIKIDFFVKILNKKIYRLIHIMAYTLTSVLLLFFIYLAIKSIEFGDAKWITFGYIPAFFMIFVKILIKRDININE